jgi:hypothetical protein
MSRKPNSAAKNGFGGEDDRRVGGFCIALPDHLCGKADGHRNHAGIDNRQQRLAHPGSRDRFSQPGAEQTEQAANQELPAGHQERRGDTLGEASDKKDMQGPEDAAGNHPQVADRRLDALDTGEQPRSGQTTDRRRPDRPVRACPENQPGQQWHQRHIQGREKTGVGHRRADHADLLQGRAEQQQHPEHRDAERVAG